MAKYRVLNNGVHCIDALYIRPELAAFYLVMEADEVAIIDTGTTRSIPNLLETLTELGIEHGQIKYVIPTHVHLDHAGGAGQMMELFDQASLVIHPRGARHMIDPRKLVEASIAIYGEAPFRELYGEIKAVPEHRVIIANDGDSHHLGKRELVFIDTPGHARHHFCVYDQLSNGIFTGDTFGVTYPGISQHPRGLIPSSTPVQFDPQVLPDSLDRLISLEPDYVYLAHFAELSNPRKRAADVKRWIDEYVSLCEEVRPADAAGDQVLEQRLTDLIVPQIADGNDLSGEQIRKILQHDIRLNAQGLAIWWRTTQNGQT